MHKLIASGRICAGTVVIVGLLALFSAMADRPRTISSYSQPSTSYTNISVPRQPLRSADIERWAMILDLSDAQREYMQHEYQNFVVRHNAFLDEHAPEYYAQSHELSTALRERGLSSPEVMNLSNRLDGFSKRLRDSLISMEHEYIRTLEPILTPEQFGGVHLIRADSTRRNCRTYHTLARWDGIELRDLWRRSAAALASPDERAIVEQVLGDYEMQLTRLIRRRSDMLFEQRQIQWENRVGRAAGTIPSNDARARFKRLMSERLELARRIRSLNELTVHRIGDLVSAICVSSFIDAVRQAVFPELYPDAAALHGLFTALDNAGELDEEAERFVAALLAEYDTRYRRKCAALESICIEWADNAEGGDSPNFPPQQLPSAIRPKLDERTELSRKYLLVLYNRLDRDVLTRHTKAVPTPFRSILAEDKSNAETETLTP